MAWCDMSRVVGVRAVCEGGFVCAAQMCGWRRERSHRGRAPPPTCGGPEGSSRDMCGSSVYASSLRVPGDLEAPALTSRFSDGNTKF